MSNSVADLHVKLALKANELEAGLRRVEQKLAGTAQTTDRLTSYLQTGSAWLKSFAVGLGTTAAAAIGLDNALGLITRSIQLAADAEQTQMSFQVMLGSAQAAADLVSKIRQFAIVTPFESKPLLDATKQLLAFGFTAKEVLPTLRMLGDVSSAMNVPLGDLTYLFGTMRSQGRAFTVDINQFAMRGIPIWEKLAKNFFGVSNQQTSSATRKLVEEGLVDFQDVKDAFDSIAGAGGNFAGMMDKQSQTLNGLASTLRDEVNVALMEFGKLLTDEIHLKEFTREMIDLAGATKILASELKPLQPFLRATFAAVSSPSGMMQMLESFTQGIGLGGQGGYIQSLRELAEVEKKRKTAEALSGIAGASGGSTSASRLAGKIYEKEAEKLRQQLAALDEGKAAVERYRLAQQGLNQTQLDYLDGLKQQIIAQQEAIKQQQEMAKLAANLTKQAQSPLGGFLASAQQLVGLQRQGLIGVATLAPLLVQQFEALKRSAGLDRDGAATTAPRLLSARSAEALQQVLDLQKKLRAGGEAGRGNPLEELRKIADADQKVQQEQLQQARQILAALEALGRGGLVKKVPLN